MYIVQKSPKNFISIESENTNFLSTSVIIPKTFECIRVSIHLYTLFVAFTSNSPKSQNNRNREAFDNFQKSYELLIAHSGHLERNKNNADEETSNTQFKIPSLPRCEVLVRKTNVMVNDSPKTSRPLDDEMKTVTEKVKHPIAELSCPQNGGRRFFKRKSDSSDDTNQCTKKCKNKRTR